MSCCINIIVYPTDSKSLYDCVKYNINDIKKRYNLDIQHIQTMKTEGKEYNFIV